MWKQWLFFVLMVVILAPILLLTALSLLARRPGNLGVKEGRLAPCPASPNCVCTQAEDAEHCIEPLRFTGSPKNAWQRLKIALGTLPRVNIVTESENYLHAECTTLIFRFVDDVEFWLDEPNQVIHFRSASRAGRSDLGVNRHRMETVRQAFANAALQVDLDLPAQKE